AAKEIKSLINDSVEKVGTGSKLVEQAGTTMDEIVTAVKRVTDIMAEISAASQEQSQGIEQVNTTVTQMDEVTQQNAALVEQASASAKSLEEQADGLSSSVAHFLIGEEDQVAPPVAAAPHSTKPAAKPATKIHLARKAMPARPVARPTPHKANALPATGTDDQWTEF
ncbi:MAG TPA: methyl-accepting chemotaxis protein, partial [Nevskiaceae bacterium]|nr:methyl-accepting chemotaxis protein [Nevskiaceae bacterium]